jgi:hypothetical protein
MISYDAKNRGSSWDAENNNELDYSRAETGSTSVNVARIALPNLMVMLCYSVKVCCFWQCLARASWIELVLRVLWASPSGIGILAG